MNLQSSHQVKRFMFYDYYFTFLLYVFRFMFIYLKKIVLNQVFEVFYQEMLSLR